MKNSTTSKKPPKRKPPTPEWGIAHCQDCDKIDSEEEFTPTDGRAHLVCPGCGGSNCFMQDEDQDPGVVAYWDADKLCKLGLSRPMINAVIDQVVVKLVDDAVADAYREGAEHRLDEDDDDASVDYRKKTCWE